MDKKVAMKRAAGCNKCVTENNELILLHSNNFGVGSKAQGCAFKGKHEVLGVWRP